MSCSRSKTVAMNDTTIHSLAFARWASTGGVTYGMLTFVCEYQLTALLLKKAVRDTTENRVHLVFISHKAKFHPISADLFSSVKGQHTHTWTSMEERPYRVFLTEMKKEERVWAPLRKKKLGLQVRLLEFVLWASSNTMYWWMIWDLRGDAHIHLDGLLTNTTPFTTQCKAHKRCILRINVHLR